MFLACTAVHIRQAFSKTCQVFMDYMLEPQKIEFVSFPESLFKVDRVQDPVLGNTSILAADFKVLTWYVQKFNDGTWFEPEGPVPDPITP